MKKAFIYNPIGFLTLVKREISRFMKVWVQTLIAPLLSNILFLGVFGGVISARDSGPNGVPYLVFLVPGLCAMGAIFAAVQNPSFSLIAQKMTNTIQDLNGFPMTVFEKASAFVVSGTFRGFLIALMTYAAALIFVPHRVWNPFLFVGMIVLISFIFSCLGLIAGLSLRNFDGLNFILSIILTPMVYFGGVFFNPSAGTGFLAKAAAFNPLSPLIHLARYAFTGRSQGPVLFHLLLSVVYAALSFGAAYLVFRKGVGLKES